MTGPQARIFVPFATGEDESITSNSLSNLDEATAFGAEFDISWTPIKGLDISAGGTWLDTEIEQNENPNVPQNAEIFDGNPLPFASKYSGVLSVGYNWDLSEDLQATLQGNGKYQSAFYFDAEGLEERRQSGYEIIDGSATLHFNNGIDFGVFGRNLTNSDYGVSGFGFIGYNTFRGNPRSYGAFLKYSY